MTEDKEPRYALVEHGEKLGRDTSGRPPGEIKEIEEDLNRLEEYVDEAVANARIRYTGKVLTRDNVMLIVKGLVLNKTNKEICAEVNKQRTETGHKKLSVEKIAVWRFRNQYKNIVLAVRKMIFQKIPDLFENANPIFQLYRFNIMMNQLWKLGVSQGLMQGYVDKDTQGIVRLYMKSVDQVARMIKINVDEISDEQEDAEKIDAVAFLKRLKKKYGIKATEELVLDDYLRDRYAAQLKTGAKNEAKQKP